MPQDDAPQPFIPGCTNSYQHSAFSMCHNCTVLNEESKALVKERDEFRAMAGQLAVLAIMALQPNSSVHYTAEAAALLKTANKVYRELRLKDKLPPEARPKEGQ